MATRSNLLAAARADSPWLLPWAMPGQYLGPGYVTTILNTDVPAWPTRATAWRQLVREGPPINGPTTRPGFSQTICGELEM